MAVAAQGDQSVVVEVRAALGALQDVMHLEAVRGETARLALPAGAGEDLGPDLAPGFETGLSALGPSSFYSGSNPLPMFLIGSRPGSKLQRGGHAITTLSLLMVVVTAAGCATAVNTPAQDLTWER